MFGGLYGYGSKAFACETIGAPIAGLKVYLNGVSVGTMVKDGTLEIDEAINQRSTAQFTLVNPTIDPPTTGGQVLIMRDEERLFLGTIESITSGSNSPQTALTYQVSCSDLSQALDHLILNGSYTYASLPMIIKDFFTQKLSAEGLYADRIDYGATFPLVNANYTRYSDVLRDLAQGAGVYYWIDNYRRLQMMSPPLPDAAPVTLDTAVWQNFRVERARSNYRNVMIVICQTADGSSSIVVTRENTVEILARQAAEGGTGRYEVAETITHPSSNDPVACQRLATSYAVIALSAAGSIQATAEGMTNRRGFRRGMVATITMPNFPALGTWTITEVIMTHKHADIWAYQVMVTSTSALQMVIDSYLKIVQASKASVQLPIGLFNTIVEFLASGTWTVPGSGLVDIEIDTFGCGGGGGGYDALGLLGLVPVNGGNGGAGGKAVTFLTVPAGAQLAVVIGTAGAGGVGDSVHTVSTFTSSTTWTVPGSGNVRVHVVCNGGGGGGGGQFGGALSLPGGAGGTGGQGIATRSYAAGTVLTINVGAGGAHSTGAGAGTGGTSSVVDTGGTIAAGYGGTGGADNIQINGPPGGGAGDSAVTGGGAGGGAGGAGGVGADGGAGSIVVTYCDANDGVGGTVTTVSLGGVVKAQANGGFGGVSGVDGGSNGADGSGVGDQVYAGGGQVGGIGGVFGIPDGTAANAAKVQFRY